MEGSCLEIDHLVLALGGMLVGIMRAGFGGGVGVVAAPVLALVMPAKMTLGVILPLTQVSDVISARYYWGRWVGQHIWALLPGMVVGVAIGWGVLDVIPELWFKRVLGGLACLFAVLQVLRERILSDVRAPGRWLRFGAGVVLGLVSALIHAGGVVMMLYLLPQGLTGRTFVATAWVLGVILNLIKLVAYLSLGLVNRESLILDLWVLPALAVGALVGIFLNRRLLGAAFNRIILVAVLVLGIKLMVS